MLVGREAIAEYVERERALRNWSLSEVARQSGGHIKSASTLVNIVNGNVKTISEDTFRGLAQAFSSSEGFIVSVYHGTGPGELSIEELSLLDCYRRIQSDRRPDALAYVKLIAHMHPVEPPAAPLKAKHSPLTMRVRGKPDKEE